MRVSGLLLEPLDVLFFRSSRPDDPLSVLPHPENLAGALRTALLASAGIDIRRTGRDRERPIRDVLAERGAPPGILDATFAGPFLVRARREVLLPSPRTLFRNGETVHRAWPATASTRRDEFLRLAGRGCDGLAPVWLGGEAGAEAERVGDDFLSLRDFGRFLAGEDTFPEEALVHRNQLFAHDWRIGIGIDAEKLVAEERMLYSVSLLSLARGVSFYAEIEAPDAIVSMLDGRAIRFGGEGRRVVVRRVDPIDGGVGAWSVRPTGDRAVVVAISPGTYRGPIPPVLGHSVRSASVGRPWAHSGWDATRGGPKPTRQQAPAGSVWFIQGEVPKARSLSADPEEAARGEGLFLTGVWR
jgi:CRISPR type III-B/RAMP module-associated protein Cmr3